MPFTVICDANMRGGTYIAAIHLADCPSTYLDVNPTAFSITVDGTLRDALDVAVDEDDRELGYDDSWVHVYPCAQDQATPE